MSNPISETVYLFHQELNFVTPFASCQTRKCDIGFCAPKARIIRPKKVRPKVKCKLSYYLTSVTNTNSLYRLIQSRKAFSRQNLAA